MTVERYRRCEHCQDVYTYQLSGGGAPKYNDGRHCPECREAVCKALQGIPRKAECRYVDIKELPQYQDVTLDQVRVWEANLAERRKDGLVAQRIWPGLYKLDDSGKLTEDVQSIRQVIASEGPHKGVAFRVSTWKQDPEYTIEVPMEFDLVGQKLLGRWVAYSS